MRARAAASCEGHYAFCAVSADEPDVVVGTRHECPLVVGVGEDEMFFASAIPAFLAHTRRVVVLEDGDVVTLRADGAEYTDVAGEPLVREETEFPGDDDAAEKGGYETFMLKEIHEQPAALRDTLAGRLREDGTVDLSEVGMGDEFLRRLRRIFIVACGTSYHAGLIVSYAIEQLARVPVQIDVASEFRYRAAGLRPGHAGHRHHAVGRDGRHARRDAARARGRLAGARAHQHHGQPGHARRRLRAVHARRAWRSAWRRPRRTPPRSPPCCSSPCASPGRAAP